MSFGSFKLAMNLLTDDTEKRVIFVYMLLKCWTVCFLYLAGDSTACLSLSGQHFLSAFEKFTPSTLHNVPILKPGDLSWSDVGGLHDIRAVLEQTLLWPTKVKW